MTFLELSRRNAWRKPFRTVLIIFSIAVTFLIYGLTGSFMEGSQGPGQASGDRLVVSNMAGQTLPLPLGYLSRINSEKGVAASTYATRIRGFFQNEKNVVIVSAVDPQAAAVILGHELGLTTSMLAALAASRDRILVGRALADAQGWTVGERVAISAFQMARADGSRNWNFEIAGIFEGEDASVDTYFSIARYDYVNAARARGKDTVDLFVIQPAADIDASVLAPKIDLLFANSAAQTKTQAEKQFLEAFLRQIADIGAIINMVVSAAFVTILMIVVNTLAFAVRERRFEIGLLKTLGFSPLRIMSLVLSETLLIFAIGALLGTLAASALSLLAGASIGLNFTSAVAAKALFIAVLLGLLAGFLPAATAMRMPLSQALKSR